MKKTLFIAIAILLALGVSIQNASAVTKSRAIVSPYAQTDADGVYTFVGINHPSLTSAATQIGLTVTTVGFSSNPTTTFTISAGETHRIFIAATNHSSVNSSTITGSNVKFLGTTNGSTQFGSVLITANGSDPGSQIPSSIGLRKFSNVSQISVWGAIVVPSNATGFAAEFIGDAADSSDGGNAAIDQGAPNADTGLRATGTGIN